MQVLGSVPLPRHLRVWGIDSGISHSVAGADYSAVRIGAFMGRRILASASEQVRPLNCLPRSRVMPREPLPFSLEVVERQY